MRNRIKAALLFTVGGLLGLAYLVGVTGAPLATSGPQRLPPVVSTVAMVLGLLVGIGLFIDVGPLVDVFVAED